MKSESLKFQMEEAQRIYRDSIKDLKMKNSEAAEARDVGLKLMSLQDTIFAAQDEIKEAEMSKKDLKIKLLEQELEKAKQENEQRAQEPIPRNENIVIANLEAPIPVLE